MARNRLFTALSRVVGIKTGEERIAALLFLYFFFITTSYGIIKPLRNAIYLQENTAERLPIAYLLTALFMGFVVAIHSKYQTRFPREKLIIVTLIFFAISILAFAFLFRTDLSWVALVFFIWANAFIMVLSTQFFIVLNDVFNPREARRLIGFLISGGILGGIIGNLFVGFLDLYIHDYLLFVAFGMILINIFIVGAIFIRKKKYRTEDIADISPNRRQEKPSKKVGFKDSFDTIRSHSYLRLLAAVVTITLIVSTLIDWQYNTVVEFSKKPALYATTFGKLNAVFLVVSFFFQLFLTSNIIKRFGIRITLLIYPVLLFICALSIGTLPTLFVIGPLGTLVLAGFIKGADQGLDFSLNQSVRELLYIPVTPELKYKAKVFIDMFLNRFAKSFGALILMIVMGIRFAIPPDQEPFFIWKPRILIVSIISLLFILAWIFLNLKVSTEYANTVKEKIARRYERADKIVGDKLDVDFMKLVVDTLANKERSSVLYAMDVFDLLKQEKLTPEVKKLIGYRRNERRASAIGSLIEESEFGIGPQIEEYTDDEEALLKEIQEIMSLDVYHEVMSDHVQKVLDDPESTEATEKMEVARAIGLMDSQSPLISKLDELLRDSSPDVIKYAMDSAAKLKKREHIPALVEKLRNPMTRDDAKAALHKFGAGLVGTLSDYMGDVNENIELRRSVIEVLAHIGNQEAVDFLLWELNLSKSQIVKDIIDALDLIRSGKPDVKFEERAVKSKIFERAKDYFSELIAFSETTAIDNRKIIKLSELPAQFSKNISDLFKLLGLIYPYEDIAKAEQNIMTGTREATAYAIEMLDNILKKELKDVIFPLIENLTLSERAQRCRALLISHPAFKVMNVERFDS